MKRLLGVARNKAVAYAILAVVAAAGLYEGAQATKLARSVDHRGDIHACTQENLIRTEANTRNAALADTAETVVAALRVVSESERPKGDKTNKKLRLIAKQASEIPTHFKSAKLTDCTKEFPLKP